MYHINTIDEVLKWKIVIDVMEQVLRKLGILTNIDLTTKSLKKQMENASGSKFSIIFAPKEFAEKCVVLRNMVDRTEKQISLDELITNQKDILSL